MLNTHWKWVEARKESGGEPNGHVESCSYWFVWCSHQYIKPLRFEIFISCWDTGMSCAANTNQANILIYGTRGFFFPIQIFQKHPTPFCIRQHHIHTLKAQAIRSHLVNVCRWSACLHRLQANHKCRLVYKSKHLHHYITLRTGSTGRPPPKGLTCALCFGCRRYQLNLCICNKKGLI